MTEASKDGETSVVKSADRVLAILEFVSENQPVRFNDLLVTLRLPRSSAHGLLQTMVARSWLAHDSEHRSYSLGLRSWQVGQLFHGNREIAAVAKPEMDRLAALVGEAVQLARLDGRDNTYLAISEAPRPIRLVSSVGARIPAHATGLGKVSLAQLDPAEARRRLEGAELIPLTDKTITDVETLMDELRSIRERGYALDVEECLPGTCCVAIPLITEKELVVAMSITGPTSRRSDRWPNDLFEHLHSSAERIRVTLGHAIG